MEQRPKLLFVCTSFSTFVKGDLDALQPYYQITTYQFRSDTGKQVVLSLIKEFFWLLFHIWKFEKVYIWFGDYHSFLPVFFAHLARKSSYLVVGGYDVCRIKKLNYGSFKNPVRGFMTRLSMSCCTVNLCVSRYVERKVRAITHGTNTIVIYNGTNIQQEASTIIPKKEIVLTVANIKSEQIYTLKGIECFMAVAERLPEYLFVIVGMHPKLELAHPHSSSNIRVYHHLPQNDLVEYYKSAKVYCQFSCIESFCMTVVESMLYNCVPVVTNVGGMPEVVGDSGFIVPERGTPEMVQAIKDAMSRPPSDQYEARIKAHFLLESRQKALVQALQGSV